MDIQREGVTRRKRVRLALGLGVLTVAATCGAWRLWSLPPAAQSVERSTLLLDRVKRGPMVREVRGLGILVPEEIVWIPAAFESQVSKVLVRSGAKVQPDTPLMILTNPDMELAASDLEWQVKQAEANYADLRVRLESGRLDQQASLAGVASGLRRAALTKDRDDQLFKLGLKADLEARLSAAMWEELAEKYELDKKRFEMLSESIRAQLDSQRVQIEKLTAAHQLKRRQVAQLVVLAGISGVLQELILQPGQRVKPGEVLAKVAEPRRLLARLQIAETQAKDVLIGQIASIDTRNGSVSGHVIRIDPNVINGTRTVDCALDGPLPPGAVPDLSVDGTIEIERLPNVLYVQRPVFGQPNSRVSFFKLGADGQYATRTAVRLGRSSVNTIEIIDGLAVDDQVILSDMSSLDSSDRIRLN